MAHYAGKAESIAENEGLYEPLDAPFGKSKFALSHTDGSPQADEITNIQQRVEVLLSSAKSLTSNLELALVKARQQLKREQSLFEHAKAQSDKANNGENVESKLRALEATRDELQRWIADSLAACEQDVNVPNPELLTMPDEYGSDHSQGDADTKIEEQYDRYIEAREKLLLATSALRSTLPTMASDIPEVFRSARDQVTTVQRPSHPRHKSNVSMSKLGERPTTTSLAEMQSTHLPDYCLEKLLSTYTTHLKDQTLAQDARLLQVLGLLSHESHLLPAHPVPSMVHVQGEGENKPSQQQIEVERLLRAWAFASDSASEVLETNVQSHVSDARGALEKAKASMEEMYVMEGMREEVLATTPASSDVRL